ncbi:MAG: hypothetical protein U0795_25225 [Pirellulales bacterium]
MSGSGTQHSSWSRELGECWNAFWFGPPRERTATAMRVVTTATALIWLIALTPLLDDWFTGTGWLTIETVREWRQRDPLLRTGVDFSFWNWVDQPIGVYVLHGLSLLVVAVACVGWGGRWSMAAAWLVVLSYVHRLQLVTGVFEYMLTGWMAYLVIGPGRAWPWGPQSRRGGLGSDTGDWRTGLAVRMMQVHLSMVYGYMALSKLTSDVWWNGEGIWWLIGQAESPLVDWIFLDGFGMVLNLWTHLILLLEISLAVLIWIPLWRPLLRPAAVVHWVLLGLVTGQVGLAALMAISTWVLWRDDDSNCTRDGFAYIL